MSRSSIIGAEKEVLFIGAECSGKTSLIRNLTRFFDTLSTPSDDLKDAARNDVTASAEECEIDVSFSKDPFVIKREVFALPTSGVDNQTIQLDENHFKLLQSNLQLSSSAVSSLSSLPSLPSSAATITVANNVMSGLIIPKSLKLREVGAGISFASNWGSYLGTADIVAFVVDASDNSSIGTSVMLLHEALNSINSANSTAANSSNAALTLKPPANVVICLTKCDVCDFSTIQAISSMINFDELKPFFRGDMKLIFGSAFDFSLSKSLFEIILSPS